MKKNVIGELIRSINEDNFDSVKAELEKGNAVSKWIFPVLLLPILKQQQVQ
jgi:hypothetical protein